MKMKCLFLSALILAFVSIGFAQSKTNAATADVVVKNLYAAQKADKSPFNQTKNRALVDQYFVKDLADMIWKDAVDAKGELGAIDFDPLYGTQEEATDTVIEKPREAGGPDNAFVKVTFKTNGKADKVDYELTREAGKGWKIVGISYGNGEDLASILRYSQDAEFKKEYDSNQTFTGDYTVGKVKCNVTPTLNGILYQIQCDGEDNFKLYAAEGTETETAYIYTDDKGAEKGKFVFKNGAADGKFIDASGKSSNVSRIK